MRNFTNGSPIRKVEKHCSSTIYPFNSRRLFLLRFCGSRLLVDPTLQL